MSDSATRRASPRASTGGTRHGRQSGDPRPGFQHPEHHLLAGGPRRPRRMRHARRAQDPAISTSSPTTPALGPGDRQSRLPARPVCLVGGHGHYHLKDFNEFLFFTAAGNLATVGYKQAFCAIDIERISPTASATPRFGDCNADQGISAGWADVYSAFLACQFVVIDGLPDGDYTLQSTTNAQARRRRGLFGRQHRLDGPADHRQHGRRDRSAVHPEDRIPFNRTNVAAAQFGGRWKVVEGSHWMLDTGPASGKPNARSRSSTTTSWRDVLRRPTAVRPTQPDDVLAERQRSGPVRAARPARTASLSIAINLAVVEIGGRWKVVEGTHWLLDFGPARATRVAALALHPQARFDEICLSGDPTRR